MFGAAPKSTPVPGSLFGSLSTPTSSMSTTTTSSAPFSFGSNLPSTSASTTAPTSISNNSLFGGFSNNNANTTNNNPLFSSNTNNTLQQQQPKSYLDLESCLPDSKVPHFIVTPSSVTRSTVPANFFQSTKAKDDLVESLTPDARKAREPLSSSLAFNERNTTLPTYLTSGDSNSSTVSNGKLPIHHSSSKKRVLEDVDAKSTERNVLAKRNEQGVFTRHTDSDSGGFDRNLKKQGNVLPPVNGLKDVGMTSSVTQQQQQQRELSPYKSPSFLTTSYSQANHLDSSAFKTRVRVFGYDAENIEKIVKHFTNIGPLSEPYVTQGNWITFNYTSPESAKKAIAFNGMNIDQNHLIGVTYDERAQEIESLQYQTFSNANDLFTRSNGFMNIFQNTNHAKQQQMLKQHQDNSNKEPNLLERIKEKLLGW